MRVMIIKQRKAIRMKVKKRLILIAFRISGVIYELLIILRQANRQVWRLLHPCDTSFLLPCSTPELHLDS